MEFGVLNISLFCLFVFARVRAHTARGGDSCTACGVYGSSAFFLVTPGVDDRFPGVLFGA